jgi:signal transduction histidine kinase
VQREKAAAGAQRIEQFIDELRRQIGWTTRSAWSPALIEQRQIDYFQLLRQALPITEISHLDAGGREDLKVSRVGMNTIGSGVDYSADPRFVEAKRHKVWFSPVYFLRDTEPYMTLAIAGAGRDGGVTVTEINLKFIWDPITRIRAGKAGYAYVVDGSGHLIAHPDLGLVLRKTDLSHLPQVAALRAPAGQANGGLIGQGIGGGEVVTAHAAIPVLGWTLFVDLPIAEAFAPVYESLLRSGLLILVGLVLAIGASLLLSRRIVGPIQALTAGAARIGSGELAHRIDIRTDDELQDLAVRFNAMAEGLQESYGQLERRVEERTRELSDALAVQTATSDVLKVISRSAFDLDAVLNTLVDTAGRLCSAGGVYIYRPEADGLRMAAIREVDPLPPGRFHLQSIGHGTATGRAALDRRTVQILDVLADPDFEYKDEMREYGFRTFLAVPLLREDTLIGVMTLGRTRVEGFTQREIDLVTVFADQAVIAIENARLLQEIQARTAALAQSVDELRALGESGRSVVATLDLGRVLDTIMDGAVELGRADAGAIFRYTRPMREFSLWRAHGLPDDYAARLGAMQIPAAQTAMGAALIEDKTRELDIEESPLLPLREATISAGFRHVLVVPLIRGKRGYGAMVLYYADRDSVPERAHDLMQTFASQSVVAIQNARLFREIAEKSRELEVASQHKSQFLANMSHELRTPMNAILGYTELMLDGLFGEVNADMKETLDRVQQNGKHLLSLINDVLDLSKIEAGRLELTFADYDANTVVQSVMAAARPLAEAKSIAIAAEVAPDLPLGWGDERRLMQVLLNFASNAVKFTDKGSVQIAARGRDGAIEFAVTDTGPGIDPKDQARIFEEFQQADNSITREKGGTGLGLAISKRIVEMHGGTISVESRLGHGATFRAVVPVRADAGEAAA